MDMNLSNRGEVHIATLLMQGLPQNQLINTTKHGKGVKDKENQGVKASCEDCLWRKTGKVKGNLGQTREIAAIGKTVVS